MSVNDNQTTSAGNLVILQDLYLRVCHEERGAQLEAEISAVLNGRFDRDAVMNSLLPNQHAGGAAGHCSAFRKFVEKTLPPHMRSDNDSLNRAPALLSNVTDAIVLFKKRMSSEWKYTVGNARSGDVYEATIWHREKANLKVTAHGANEAAALTCAMLGAKIRQAEADLAEEPDSKAA